MENDRNRPSWDEYFMEIAELVKKRSTCLRREVGAIIVKDNRILSTGYNGAPKGLKHCRETGCIRSDLNVPSGERHELCRGLHAEQNAIIQAAVFGAAIDGATIYITLFPCVVCTKMIINSGIKRIVLREAYNDPLSMKMLEESGITVVKMPETTESD
ncbi:deoxycytidylate deaminase [Lutispora saccharofermentans]|uniref:Cytidine/deoxycytidylate deaminase family protein n=1 Tax=Lutispora saccharofermentans TaxID=3024236 RepID=A0ABT1NDU3_9FIRM|nr:cytidine/deoxycytidylate deaminase family protein [Lutispora saccharofermentans]MCQ1528516.1 cytidine/deoxycytidylate deaminase family protein [Lutispora saccharofermentans]